MSEKVATTTIQKLDGTKTVVESAVGQSMEKVLKDAGEYKPDQYSYMISGKSIEGGQKQVDDSLLSQIKVEMDEQILIIPKTIAG